MTKINKFKNILFKLILVFALFVLWVNPVFAHKSPANCMGSGLQLSFFSDVSSVSVGGNISYTITIFNGLFATPVICDASDIQASITTPDGQIHSIPLSRTALSSMQSDTYTNVVVYTARIQDMNAQGELVATASNTGVIHQNVVNSQGGSNQGVNVKMNGTLHVVKSVVNNNGGIATASSFNVHVKKAGVDVSGSPALGAVSPGTLYSLSPGTFVVSEDPNTSYTPSFSGACSSNGTVVLSAGVDKVCIVTNTDIASPPIPPVIPVVVPPVIPPIPPITPNLVAIVSGVFLPPPIIKILKTPEPSSLPDGPGLVTYTYKITNLGKAAMRGIWVKDDKCDLPKFVSGDIDNDSMLDLDEEWIYSCTKIVYSTEMNTATTHGQANGWDAYDSINATVVVGGGGDIYPVINIEKVPNRLTPLPVGGGYVIYTYTVTNSGLVAMHDVSVVDDKCEDVSNPSGDSNNNEMLELGEIWTYFCQTRISVSTKNTAKAQGTANGLTATGYAFATVLVSAPGFPDTGFPSKTEDIFPDVIWLNYFSNFLKIFSI
jgi:hypothetical protein